MKPTDERLWRITDHACRACFARVLTHKAADGKRIYRCSNCGTEAEGYDHRSVCACGMKLKTGASAGLVCRRNTAPTPEVPAEILVESER